jgi:DNA polymerase-3 subunit alpha
MASIANINGFYYVPRSTRILSKSTKRISWYYPETYMENSGKILNLGENQAEEALVWWKQQFGADFFSKSCATIKRMKIE